NEVRELFLKARSSPKGSAERAAALASLKSKLNSGYLPMTLKELNRIWGGKNPPLDPNIPVYLRPHDQSVEQAHKISGSYENWHAKADSVYDLYRGGIALEWTGKRGGHTNTLLAEGSTTNPLLKRETAKYIDPMTMLNRATNSLLKGRYL